MSKYNQRKGLNLSAVASSILEEWSENKTFEKSVSSRENGPSFVFYEGPPSSNGLPGIHHVMARTIKDVFCRYKTLKGYKVNRKAGWDTHGLPVELGVEKELGITKEDIGKSISIEEYNEACKSAVMRYTDVWNDLTHKMGYWVDTKNPYVTYENKYIESVWWLLKEAFKKGLIYKGYTVQPYSPMAGTGLSSHEINQPGCYKNVKDTSITAQFLLENNDAEFFKTKNKIYFLAWTTTPWTLPSNTALAVNKRVEYVAWTTTPWTLPSNTALAVNKRVEYVVVETKNQYTNEPMSVVLAEKLVSKVFSAPYTISDKVDEGKKQIFYKIVQKLKGSDLEGLKYKQLMPLSLPVENPEKAFKIIHGDFVSTDDGTGIVHIAPTKV